ncbi:reverse transcriptase domain-containing protein [Tanacetum coccineum]
MVTSRKLWIFKPLERMIVMYTTTYTLPRLSSFIAQRDPHWKKLSSSSAFLQRIITSLHSEFAMTDLGSLNYFLGISAQRSATGLFLSQSKFAEEILERAHMQNCNPCRTPVDTESKLGSDGDPVNDPTLYRNLAASCIIYYSGLRVTDAVGRGCPVTRLSTSGYCVFLGDNLLSWSAKRQVTLSRSSAEAEYRGVANVVAETAWIRNLLCELHTPLFYSNLSFTVTIILKALRFSKLQLARATGILKQLKKANASLTQELKECKTNLDESSRALGEATSSRDSSLIALQTKQTELEKYTALNDLTSDYKILQTKLNETLGLLALKDIDIKEGLKTKTYEISVVNQKHDELVKKSLLTRSQFEGQLKEKTKVISDLKVKEGKDIDTMIEMDKQIKFLNEILYKRNQSIQTIHMLAPKCATYHGRSTFANPKYLKKAQSDKPRLYEIPYDTSDPANRFCPNGEETVTLEKESRSKLDKDTVKPYNYTYQNSLYETFKPPSKTYLDQLERAKEVRKTMWRKTFVRTKPNIAKNELDELESEKADFSNIYDLLLEECVSKDVTCSYLHSLSDLNANTELQCLYLHKVKECECLAQKLSKQTESVNKEVHNNLWVPTGKLLNSCTGKVDSEPAHGSIVDIPHIHACKQTLGLSAGIQASVVNDKWRLLKITLQAPFLNVQKTFDRSRSSLDLHGNDVCSHQFRPRSSSNDF